MVSAALAVCTRVPTAAMLPEAVKAAAPTWVSLVSTKSSVTRTSPFSVTRVSPLSVMRGPSANATPPSSDKGAEDNGEKPNISYPMLSACSLRSQNQTFQTGALRSYQPP